LVIEIKIIVPEVPKLGIMRKGRRIVPDIIPM
jgi:hypothetical protein